MMGIRITTALTVASLLASPLVASAQQGRATNRIAAMDRNGDGRVTRQEWTGTREAFDERDWNQDGVLSGTELRPGARRGQARRADGNDDRDQRQDRDDKAAQSFSGLDVNRDGHIALNEWREPRARFTQLDRNHDGILSRAEFNGAPSQRSRAYDAGYERGRTEGLQAGREDRERRQGWDLEGQRELEAADSGYTPAVGARADYQSGYREAFRDAYREGYGR
jgi:hypothetical protein